VKFNRNQELLQLASTLHQNRNHLAGTMFSMQLSLMRRKIPLHYVCLGPTTASIKTLGYISSLFITVIYLHPPCLGGWQWLHPGVQTPICRSRRFGVL